MSNDLTIAADQATGFSMQCLTPSAKTVLAKAFDPLAVFTADEIALIEPVSHAVVVSMPADERFIRQSIGALAVALPAQNMSELAGQLKLNTFLKMLAGCDERALSHACRRCLDDLDWMPTIHQLKERMAGWVGEDAAAIVRARAILRTGRRAPVEPSEQDMPTFTDADVDRVNALLRRAGCTTRFHPDGSSYQTEVEAESADEPATTSGRSDNVPFEEAA